MVTTSLPGRDKKDTTRPVTDRLALVPIDRPDSVTRVRVLRRGVTVFDSVPADALLGPEVPRTLSRVVASEATGRLHRPVQVRTDGRTACRVTAGGFHPQGAQAAHWNLTDAACAEIDGSLRLLLADDRSSTVAGLAPPQARAVRLHWRDGSVSVVDTTWRDEVNAFVDPEHRRADRLVLAEAIDSHGVATDSVRPTRT